MDFRGNKNLARHARGAYQNSTAPPMKRNALELDCPCGAQTFANSRRERRTPTWWTCENCHEIIDHGYDGYVYCSCGRASINYFEFKCSNRNHGKHYLEFKAFDLSYSLAKLRPKPVLNVLLLGETGTGKSTWINSIAYYLTFSTLDKAGKEKKKLGFIGGSFNVVDNNYESRRIVLGADDDEDQHSCQSTEPRARTYVIEQKHRLVRLIDTPGFRNTRGNDVDLNFDHTLKLVSQFDQLNAICIFLKSDETRLDANFRSCIQNLLKYLHRSVIKNIVFCFTHARSCTSYRPGDSLPSLKKLLKDQRLAIDLEDHNVVYCLDNEAIQFLFTRRQNKFSRRDIKQFDKSWKWSREETKRLLKYVSRLKPHQLQTTQSLNNVIQNVLTLSQPIGDVSQNIQANIAEANNKLNQLKSCELGKDELKEKLHFTKIIMYPRKLKYPRTVCTSDRCVKYRRIGNSEQFGIDFVTHCHEKCYMGDVVLEEGDAGHGLELCKVIGSSSSCSECGCRRDEHMYLTCEVIKEAFEFMEENTRSLIESKASAEESTEMAIRKLKKRIRNLESEQNTILEASAQLAMLLHEDTIQSYLVKLVRLEEQKMRLGGSRRTFNGLKKLLTDYEARTQILEVKSENLDVGDACELIDDLFSLPLCGYDLRSAFEAAQVARREIMAIQEVRHKIE